MHSAVVREFKSDSTGPVTLALGFIPSYAIVKNLVSGQELQYVNTAIGLSSMAIAELEMSTTTSLMASTLTQLAFSAGDSKLTRTAVGTIGAPNDTGAGLVVAEGVADISDADGEQCVLIAFRSDV